MGFAILGCAKKDGHICGISDLRQLKKVIRRKQYPLPIIKDNLRKCSGYKFFTKLHISMQYYSFKLDEHSQDICTIITLFGKYKYLRLLMKLKCFIDIAQSIMESILAGINDVDVYIDDVGVFSPDCDHHIKLLGTILFCLQEHSFTINSVNVNGP
ncbi:hypothetical protein ACHAW6_014591 [Cyclotella cf. meneghiniana]